MGYDTQFTQDNRQLLEKSGFLNKKLINKSGSGVRVSISWTQAKRNLFGNTENYKECDYYIEGQPKSIVKVFVAEECGNPPSSLRTSAHSQKGGVLHFGFVFLDDETGKAIFFVIHPNSWGPYQHRFRTSGLTGLINGALKSGAGKAAGMAAGAAIGSVFPGVGTVAGAVVGGGVGWIAEKATPSYLGDYLRYIGG